MFCVCGEVAVAETSIETAKRKKNPTKEKKRKNIRGRQINEANYVVKKKIGTGTHFLSE